MIRDEACIRRAVPGLVLLALAGCDQTRSVDYYLQHGDEAREVLARCQAEGSAGDNCGNAAAAITRKAREEFEAGRRKAQDNIRSGAWQPEWNGK